MDSAILLYFALAVSGLNESDPMKTLHAAQAMINNSTYIGYAYEAHWPNPVGTIDTLSGTCTFRKNANQYYPYDYVATGRSYDFVYVDDQFKNVSHEDSTVLLYSADDMKANRQLISDNILTMTSPITLLNKPSWQYVQDTLLGERPFADYRFVEMDTMINEKKVHVELHIFIDKGNVLLGRYERRAFLDGKSSQRIVYTLSDYQLAGAERQIVYNLPSGYISKRYGDREKLVLLKEGQAAPDFSCMDIDGNKVSLKSLRGKKVVILFSVINCGYCMLAVKHINRDGFTLPENMAGIYINPEDDKPKVYDYRSKLNIPFPAIAAAKDIGKAYGVSGFPTFFVINEQGIIEKVVVGYREEFLDGLAK